MASQNHPLSKEKAPDTATSYERAKPRSEAGQGRLDNNNEATPTDRKDQLDETVAHRQSPRQLNADDVVDQRETRPPQSGGDSKKK